ncbi:MAG: HEAT repeat domain-containing protein [Planctomycetes bacterium]|nr:HEAT repeat domain-containing protein [Planctomycetota bacterium]
MRIAAIGATLLLAFAACSTTESSTSPYQQPNSLMAGEIHRRMEQIPYQHRDELLQNLLWLAQTGEQTIPALLEGLRHENAKVRSSSAWVLGRLRDHRTIPNLQAAMRDRDETVRLEVARTLVLLGDLAWSPTLIEGLDSPRKEVRYMCHEALKTATGHDFGYDHLNPDEADLRVSVLRWRQWWSEYSGDTFFAANYQQKHQLGDAVAAPMGETKDRPLPVEPEAPTNP